MALTAALVVTLMAVANAQSPSTSSSNKFWLLLEDTSVFKCQGATGDVSVTKDDVVMTNTKGQQVHYLEGPGTYVLTIKNIQVSNPLPNMSGQMSGVVQVPVVQVGNAFQWDYPYSLFPEKTVLGTYKCGKNAGVVQDGGKQYCRYCDVCSASQKATNVLTKGKVDYLPKEGSSPDEQSFNQICNQVSPKTYVLTRTIQLPDKNTMNQQINGQSQGIGSELKQRLNKGKGKMQCEMQLISSDQAPASQDQVNSQSQNCRCCSASAASSWTCKLNPLGCNQQTCAGQYAQNCVQGNSHKAACFSVQFNYVVTDNPADVRAFLQKNNYKDEFGDVGGPAPPGGASGQTGGQSQNGNAYPNKQRCMAKLQSAHPTLVANCQGSKWDTKKCCAWCQGSC